MDAHGELGVYIPKEAEVKSIPLKHLPNSVRKKIGLLLPDEDTSRKAADPPDVIWICPAVIKRKDQGQVSAENTQSLLGTVVRAGPNPLQMSFVSSNRTAWEALKNVSSGQHLSKTHLRQDSPRLANQNAVFIYRGQLYLCIRKPARNQGQSKTSELHPSLRPAVSSTSRNLEQNLVSDNRQKMKTAAGKLNHFVKKDVLKRKETSRVEAEPLGRHPSTSEHKADGQCIKVPRQERASEETAQRPALVQPQEEQQNTSSGCEMDNVGDENAAERAWNDELECDVQTDSPDEHLWMPMQSLGATSLSLQGEFDFKELENEEKIAQLKAKLMQDDAALNSLLF